MMRLKQGKSNFDPNDLIKSMKGKFKKYSEKYGVTPNQVFMLLPSLMHVHRKKSHRKLKDYETDFENNSGLPKKNLILLSTNLLLDLSRPKKEKEYEPTTRFEKLVDTLVDLSNTK